MSTVFYIFLGIFILGGAIIGMSSADRGNKAEDAVVGAVGGAGLAFGCLFQIFVILFTGFCFIAFCGFLKGLFS